MNVLSASIREVGVQLKHSLFFIHTLLMYGCMELTSQNHA